MTAGRPERPPRLVVGADPELAAALARLAHDARLVFFAGLPGTGKSLLAHQLAQLARAAGRVVHVLQWDVARPVFEAHEVSRRYPLADGVTHPVIRKAVGLWARRALAAWSDAHPSPGHLLVGETPFVGGRLIELARRGTDAAELLLAAPSCRFVIPVPSREVRAFVEGERARRAARPVHQRETEDAPPHVLQEMWREVATAARMLGLAAPAAGGSYDPDAYRRVYEIVLGHRHRESLPLDVLLPTSDFSVYDAGVERRDLTPTTVQVVEAVREVEAACPDLSALERALARWYDTSGAATPEIGRVRPDGRR